VTVREGGKDLWKEGALVGAIGGITSGSESEEYVTFDVESGSYEFTLSGR